MLPLRFIRRKGLVFYHLAKLACLLRSDRVRVGVRLRSDGPVAFIPGLEYAFPGPNMEFKTSW